MNRLVIVALLAMVVLGLAAPSWGQASITGRVIRPDGNPVPDALVGLKLSAQATADAVAYTKTDENGNYSFDYYSWDLCYVAAWAQGYSPSDDQTVDVSQGGTFTVPDLQLKDQYTDLIYHQYTRVSASVNSGSAKTAVNGQIEEYDGWGAAWNTGYGNTGTQCFYINLGSPQNVRDIITWQHHENAFASDFYVDAMTSTTANPTDPNAWNNPANGITTVYSASQTGHGYVLHSYYPWDPADLGPAINPIGLSLTGVTGLRLRWETPNDYCRFYTLFEVQVHSSSAPKAIRGRVVDTDNNAVQGALVGLKADVEGNDSADKATADADQYSLTDEWGNYTFYPATGVTYNIGAWKEGKRPSATTQVTFNDATLVPDLVLDYSGENFALQSQVSASVNADQAGAAIDGVNIESAPDSQWWTSRNTGDQYFYVNLNGAKNISDVVTYQYRENGFISDYQIDAMTSTSADPLSADAWVGEAAATNGVFTAYSTTQTARGFWTGKIYWGSAPDGSGASVNPIDLALQGVTGLRFKWSNNAGSCGFYSLFEVQVHSAISASPVRGKVVDANGNPVANAIVGIKLSAKATADAVAYTTTNWEGNFSFGDYAGTYNVAAWKDGYTPSEDAQFSGEAVELVLTPAEQLVHVDGLTGTFATNHPDLAPLVVDGRGLYDWDSWGSAWNSGYYGAGAADQVFIDLGSPADIKDIVLYSLHEDSRHDDYKIDVMTNPAANALDPEQWSDAEANGVTTVYSASHTNHGYLDHWFGPYDPYGPGINAINLPVKGVKAIRITFSNCDNAFYTLFQVQIHGKSLYRTAANVGSAKALPDGTAVAITGQQLTGLGTIGAPVSAAFVEEVDRSSGIKLDTTGIDMSNFQLGDLVTLQGTLGTIDGERYIDVDTINYVNANETFINPLGMNNRFAASTAAQCLYVKVWGTVVPGSTGTTSDDRSYYKIDDGSGSPIKVYTIYPLVPATGFVRVKGVLGHDAEGTCLYQIEVAFPE